MNISELTLSYLKEAEILFGPKVNEWVYDGYEINDTPPHLRYYQSGHVKISLSRKVLDSDIQLRFQLAHEVCHLLYPQRNRATLQEERQNVFNEGISTYFSIYVLKNLCNVDEVIEDLSIHNKKYYTAYFAVRELMQIDKDAIIKLRKIQPKVNLITNSDFRQAGVIVSDVLIKSLLKAFDES